MMLALVIKLLTPRRAPVFCICDRCKALMKRNGYGLCDACMEWAEK